MDNSDSPGEPKVAPDVPELVIKHSRDDTLSIGLEEKPSLDSAIYETTASAVNSVIKTLDDQTVFLVSQENEKAITGPLKAWPKPMVRDLAQLEHLKRTKRDDRVHSFLMMLLFMALSAVAGGFVSCAFKV